MSQSNKFGNVAASPREGITVRDNGTLCVFCKRLIRSEDWGNKDKTAPEVCKRDDCKKARAAEIKSLRKSQKKEKRQETSTKNSEEKFFDPAEQDLDTIIAGSDFYEINGEVQACINCDVRLTVEDVTQDIKRCKENNWEEPKEFVCQKAACKKFRTSVSGYKAHEEKEEDEKIFANDGQRQNEDGIVSGECSRIGSDGSILVPSDADDLPPLAKIRLGLVGDSLSVKPRGFPPSSSQPILRNAKKPVVHPIVDSRTATGNLKEGYELHDRVQKLERRIHHPGADLGTDLTVSDQPSLEEEVAQILKQKRVTKLAKQPPKPSHEVRRENEQKWVKRTYDKYSLRRLHGYTQRQLAALFESPHFNLKKSPAFTPGQVAFYQDYALGKISKEVLEARIADGFYGRAGFEYPDYLKRLEDKLVNRAWYVGMLEPNQVISPGAENDDDPFESDTGAEDKMIGRGGSNLSIIGGKHRASKTFAPTYGLSSFEQGVITKRVSGGFGGNSAGPDYDEVEED